MATAERLADDHPLLVSVARKQAFLQGRLREVGFSAAIDMATVDVTTDDAVQTSAIEGETLNVNSVKSSVGRRLGIETGLRAPEDKSVTGLVDMLVDATRNCREPLTAERLCGWHAGLFPEGTSGLETILRPD